MVKYLSLTFILLFSSFITIYPSKKENTYLIDYCYSLENILARNLVFESKNKSKKFKNFANDITFIGTKKTKGALVNKIIDQYKNSKRLFIITFVPNQCYCFIGYWLEALNPGILQSTFYDKSKQRINKYKDFIKEKDEFIEDINLEYKSIKKEINKLF